MTTNPLIEAHALSRRFGPHQALQGLSLQLRRGEVLGLLGANGAGKTTTLRILAGTLAPSSGQVRVAGHDLQNSPLQAKAHIGYLPERPPLYDDAGVDDYLGYCARLHRLSGRAVADAVDRAKYRCGLQDLGRRRIGNLSKGYRQRLGLAQAIVHDPAVLILDEPGSGLDPQQRHQLGLLLDELGRDRALILSTHLLSEVSDHCQRVLILHRGRPLLDSQVADLPQLQRSHSLVLGLQRPPQPGRLQSVPGIHSVTVVDDHHLRIEHAPEKNPAEALAVLAVHEDWGLFELVPNHSDLQRLFLNLTDDSAELRPEDPA